MDHFNLQLKYKVVIGLVKLHLNLFLIKVEYTENFHFHFREKS